MEYDNAIRRKQLEKSARSGSALFLGPVFLAGLLPRCLRLSYSPVKIIGRVLSKEHE